jgi:SRSO17 transposase
VGLHAERQGRALQQFIGEGRWDDDARLPEHQRLVNETLGEEDGVLIVDGSDFPKHGEHSAGVAPQWCGHPGKKDNGQAGVLVGYASRKGATFLDRRLSLPECWFDEDHETLWQDCQIPEEIAFQTKHEWAAELVEKIMASGRMRARWVACE